MSRTMFRTRVPSLCDFDDSEETREVERTCTGMPALRPPAQRGRTVQEIRYLACALGLHDPLQRIIRHSRALQLLAEWDR